MNPSSVSTVFHFSARGLGYQLSTGGHCLALVHAAGLSSAHAWYHPHGISQPPIAWGIGREILRIIAQFQVGPFADVDLRAWELRLKSLPESLHVDCVSLARLHAYYSIVSQPHARRKGYEIMKHTDNIPADVLAKLEMSLASLEQSLLASDPQMPGHLKAIHQVLIGYPETVHLLEDAEINQLISAAKKHTQTEIVRETAAKATGSRKKPSVDDL